LTTLRLAALLCCPFSVEHHRCGRIFLLLVGRYGVDGTPALSWQRYELPRRYLPASERCVPLRGAHRHRGRGPSCALRLRQNERTGWDTLLLGRLACEVRIDHLACDRSGCGAAMAGVLGNNGDNDLRIFARRVTDEKGMVP